MTTPMKSVAPGDLCWLEIYSRDVAATKTFYGSLFGWSTKPHVVPGYDIWTIGGAALGGVMAMDANWPAEVKPHWMLYARVASVQSACAKAGERGGKVCMGPMPIPGSGQFAILDDPLAGTISAFEGEESERVDGPNALCWAELFTADFAKVAPWYENVFGWTTMKLPGTDVTMLVANSAPFASVEVVPKPERPGWLPYFKVDDLERAVRSVGELGGKCEKGPVELPGGMGAYAWMRDGQGARFGLYGTV